MKRKIIYIIVIAAVLISVFSVSIFAHTTTYECWDCWETEEKYMPPRYADLAPLRSCTFSLSGCSSTAGWNTFSYFEEINNFILTGDPGFVSTHPWVKEPLNYEYGWISFSVISHFGNNVYHFPPMAFSVSNTGNSSADISSHNLRIDNLYFRTLWSGGSFGFSIEGTGGDLYYYDISNETYEIVCTLYESRPYNIGYIDGWEDGHFDGYSSGKEVGLSEGYQNGYTDGSYDGFDEGYELGGADAKAAYTAQINTMTNQINSYKTEIAAKDETIDEQKSTILSLKNDLGNSDALGDLLDGLFGGITSFASVIFSLEYAGITIGALVAIAVMATVVIFLVKKYA